MILGYDSLMKLGPLLLDPFDPALVNPASIDIRVGLDLQYHDRHRGWVLMPLGHYHEYSPYHMNPGEFFLVSTLERIQVPIEYALDLRLKSSRAREGYNHSLAFWFDPGWAGIGTMELTNIGNRSLPLYPGLRIAQVIIHLLDAPCSKPYRGKYQGAGGAEVAKRD